MQAGKRLLNDPDERNSTSTKVIGDVRTPRVRRVIEGWTPVAVTRDSRAMDTEFVKIQTWDEIVDWQPEFPRMMGRWLGFLRRITLTSYPSDDDLVGQLIWYFTLPTIMDINDLLTLAHNGSKSGPEYFLRSIYDRVVAMKYISTDPSHAQAFMDYDAINWEQVINGIESETDMKMKPESKKNLVAKAKEARSRFKGESCLLCGQRKQTSWTPLSVRAMADEVGLAHLHTQSFVMPSKMLHPTFWGLKARLNEGNPLYNVLNAMHYLLVETVLVIDRHRFGSMVVTPAMHKAVADFLKVWVFAVGDFDGLLSGSRERTYGTINHAPVAPMTGSISSLMRECNSGPET